MIEARVNGTLTAAGVLAPTLTTKAEFKLGESVYDNLPLTGGGTVQVAGTRILPSNAKLSVAGNDVDLQRQLRRARRPVAFSRRCAALERLGFGLAGLVKADGDLTGSFAHPNVAAELQADSVVFGPNRLGHAEGHAEMRDGANGALVFTTESARSQHRRRRTRDARRAPDRHARATISSTPPRPARCAARRST